MNDTDDKNDKNSLTRRNLLQGMAAAGGAAAFYKALAALGPAEAQASISTNIPLGAGRGEHVVIVGGGVGGLTAAYELLASQSGHRVTILEANSWIGGRNLTLRPGDKLVEHSQENGKKVQHCTFEETPDEPYAPYLNAGPGRINSSHTNLLRYCKELGVELEIYVMNSRSNLVHSQGETNVNRHIGNDARGWIAQNLYHLVHMVPGLSNDEQVLLQGLLTRFGNLGTGPGKGESEACNDFGGELGVYAEPPTRGAPLEYADTTTPRAGFKVLPQIAVGEPVDPFSLQDVLASRYWETGFYQHEDFDWQPTLFQPVGGMDMIVHAFHDAIRAMHGKVMSSAVVTRISQLHNGKFMVHYTKGRAKRRIVCDHVICNAPMPMLEGVVDPGVLGPAFEEALEIVFSTQNLDEKRFLADTCKVGWQAPREMWQEPGPTDGASEALRRVVPIYGGISKTTHAITQIWYPSSAREIYLDQGVLTGAYNFGNNARMWGRLLPEERLLRARNGAEELAGNDFAASLHDGITIAWQNIQHIEGGWAQWQNVSAYLDDSIGSCMDIYNTLACGDRGEHGNWFLICGDQISQLPGWQEGAVMSALNVINLLTDEDYVCPTADSVPDSRLIVEGGF